VREPGKFKTQYKKVGRGTLELGESEKFHEAGSPGVGNFSRRKEQFLRHFQQVPPIGLEAPSRPQVAATPESLRRENLQVFRELDSVFGTVVRIFG